MFSTIFKSFYFSVTHERVVGITDYNSSLKSIVPAASNISSDASKHIDDRTKNRTKCKALGMHVPLSSIEISLAQCISNTVKIHVCYFC